VVKVGFQTLEAKDIPGGEANVAIRFATKLNKGVSADDVKALQENLEATIKKSGESVNFARDEKAGTWTLTASKGGDDPLAVTQGMNLDLSKFIKDFHWSVELANGVDLLLRDTPPDKPLAELVGLRTELRLQVRKALFSTIATSLPIPGAMEVFWATFLETMNISFDLGDVKDFIGSINPSKELEQTQSDFLQAGGFNNNPFQGFADPNQFRAMSQMQNQMFFIMMEGIRKTVTMLTDPKAFNDVRAMIKERGLPVQNQEAEERLKLMKRVIQEVTEVSVHTRSGVKLTVSLDNFLPLGLMPDPKVQERAVVRHPGAPGHAAPHHAHHGHGGGKAR